MPKQKFSATDANKKKIKQLEKEIKLMKKDLEETFAEAEPPKKKLFPLYIGIGVLVLCAVVLAVMYFYLNSLIV